MSRKYNSRVVKEILCSVDMKYRARLVEEILSSNLIHIFPMKNWKSKG